jgi:hypothetical protein
MNTRPVDDDVEKGSEMDLGNYRPLTLINSDYKLLSLILMERLVKGLDKVLGI